MPVTQGQIDTAMAALRNYLDNVVIAQEVPGIFQGMAEADVEKYLSGMVTTVLAAAAAQSTEQKP